MQDNNTLNKTSAVLGIILSNQVSGVLGISYNSKMLDDPFCINTRQDTDNHIVMGTTDIGTISSLNSSFNRKYFKPDNGILYGVLYNRIHNYLYNEAFDKQFDCPKDKEEIIDDIKTVHHGIMHSAYRQFTFAGMNAIGQNLLNNMKSANNNPSSYEIHNITTYPELTPTKEDIANHKKVLEILESFHRTAFVCNGFFDPNDPLRFSSRATLNLSPAEIKYGVDCAQVYNLIYDIITKPHKFENLKKYGSYEVHNQQVIEHFTHFRESRTMEETSDQLIKKIDEVLNPPNLYQRFANWFGSNL